MGSESKNKVGLVISVHSADFVWRAGGATVLHHQFGDKNDSRLAGSAMTMPRGAVERERRSRLSGASLFIPHNVCDGPSHSATAETTHEHV